MINNHLINPKDSLNSKFKMSAILPQKILLLSNREDLTSHINLNETPTKINPFNYPSLKRLFKYEKHETSFQWFSFIPMLYSILKHELN